MPTIKYVVQLFIGLLPSLCGISSEVPTFLLRACR